MNNAQMAHFCTEELRVKAKSSARGVVMSKLKQITAMIATTAEAMGLSISPAGIKLMAEDVEAFGIDVIATALRRARRETNKLSINVIMERIDDGRPSTEEAWGLIPRGESETVLWTAEMQAAYGACLPMLKEGDKIGARMAFKEKYTIEVAKSRAESVPVSYSVSLGTDPQHRIDVLKQAVESGRLSREYARDLLPAMSYKVTTGGRALLQSAQALAALPAPDQKAQMQRNAEQAAALLRELWQDAVKPKYERERL